MTDAPTQIADWFATCGPGALRTRAGRIGDFAPMPDYEALLPMRVVARRRAEFLTGRYLAAGALHDLTGRAELVGIGPHRGPVWPKGIAGSISHSDTVCVVQVGDQVTVQAIGIDIEPLSTNLVDFAETVRCPEDAACDAFFDAAGLDPLLASFSLKEAFFKAYFPHTKHFCDFLDVGLAPVGGDGQVRVSLRNPAIPPFPNRSWVPGRVGVAGGHLVAGVWVP
ncbi:MAG: 4'-phosphopantetheinyl transferase [Qingshengfaniella sp.]